MARSNKREVVLEILDPALFPSAAEVRQFLEGDGLNMVTVAIADALTHETVVPGAVLKSARLGAWYLVRNDIRELVRAALAGGEIRCEQGDAFDDGERERVRADLVIAAIACASTEASYLLEGPLKVLLRYLGDGRFMAAPDAPGEAA